MFLTYVLLLAGFALIIKGGDFFVDASCWIVKSTGIPAFVVGATIVSVATTLPEFLVTVFAVSEGAQSLGIANALGSVLCNTGLILSLIFIFSPHTPSKQLFYYRAAILVAAVLCLFVMCGDGVLVWQETLILMGFFGLYIYAIFLSPLSGGTTKKEPVANVLPNMIKFVLGLCGIVFGANFLVDSGVKIAAHFGIPQSVIGVTIIAVGTSLPELITTIQSIRKGYSSLGVGNIIGANLLNITLILSAATVTGGGRLYIEPMFLNTEIPIILAFLLLLLIPPFFCRGKINRWQGYTMLAFYIAFVAVIVLRNLN